MKTPQSDIDLIGRHLDGRSTPEEAAEVERRLRDDGAFRSAHAELSRLRTLLGRPDRLERDPAFWSRLSVRLDERRREELNLLPFPRRFVPLVGVVASVVILFGASFMFENRLSFLRFWETQTEAVRQAVADNMSQGSFLPFFSRLDQDRTLQFALYGSLPLDEERGTMLNVDERSREGYRLEVQKEEPRKQKKVTVSQFMAEVRPSAAQRNAIDSLLAEARGQLESAILLGDNNVMAINADLSRLNRAMASGIVGVLEPEQRVRLNRMLTERDAAYNVSARLRESPPAGEILRQFRALPPEREFVVLSPDTVAFRKMEVDLERMKRDLENEAMFRAFQERRARMVEMLSNQPGVYTRVAPGPEIAPRISLRARKDRLTIHVHHDSAHARALFVGDEAAAAFAWDIDSAGGFGFQLHVTAPGETAFVRAPGIGAPPRPGGAVDSLRDQSKRARRPFLLDID